MKFKKEEDKKTKNFNLKERAYLDEVKKETESIKGGRDSLISEKGYGNEVSVIETSVANMRSYYSRPLSMQNSVRKLAHDLMS